MGLGRGGKQLPHLSSHPIIYSVIYHAPCSLHLECDIHKVCDVGIKYFAEARRESRFI